jgi:uncharacterized protein
MAATDTAASKALAQEFVDGWNARDTRALERLLHDEFTWHVAVTEPGEPNVRPFRSKLLAGTHVWEKAIRNKAETLAAFERLFATVEHFRISPHSFTAQEDRVVVELLGEAVNPANGRRYDNLYCYLFQVKDGQIVLFREYQDTLLVFDAWVAE